MFWRLLLLAGMALGVVQAQVTVGGNAPNSVLSELFVRAWFRNNFYLTVADPPAGQVGKLGSSGLYQLFYDVNDKTGKTNARLALVKADANQSLNATGGDVYQVWASTWAYVASLNGGKPDGIGAMNTTGYPTMDTQGCPPIEFNPCQFQLFDKNYATFVYQDSTGLPYGYQLSVKGAFYTEWSQLGISGLGAAITPELTDTPSRLSQNLATVQTFTNGQLVLHTAGNLSGRQFKIAQPIFSLYQSLGGASGSVGFPTSSEVDAPSGFRRQSFEGGTIEYGPGVEPRLLTPVAEVQVSGVTSNTVMNLGETRELQASLFGSTGVVITGRPITWTTNDARVLTITPVAGRDGVAVLRAVGAGSARISATSEGKTSPAISIQVNSPCCDAGEGAPTAAIRQAFVAALVRNRLSAKLPAAQPVRRQSAGYYQEFQSVSEPVEVYWLGGADPASLVYPVRGALLEAFRSFDLTQGPLGYPTSDETPQGRQLFQNRTALAGRPVRLVSGPILDRWAVLGYETGRAGSPVSATSDFFTFTSNSGVRQSFQRGMILSALSGPSAGKTWSVLDTFADKYVEQGGPNGALGMPAAEELLVNGVRRQVFEGGVLEQVNDGAPVTVTARPRVPVVTAAPSSVTAGGRVYLSLGGFPAGATVVVTVTGLPEFSVVAANGAYTWSSSIAATAPSQTVRVRAVSGTASAESSYAVRSLLEAQVSVSKISGDVQTGVPGGELPQRLRIAVRDGQGNALADLPVTFQASPGAVLVTPAARTNSLGEADTGVRLPANPGVALVTASVQGRVVTFSAQTAPSAIRSFPRLSMSVAEPLGAGEALISEKGALLASVASILSYYQQGALVPAPNGAAGVSALNQFLKSTCLPGVGGGTVCDGFLSPPGTTEQIVNLWRVPSFVGGTLGVQQHPVSFASIRSLLAQSIPVLVTLNLEAGGVALGSHSLVALGVGAGGEIQVYDPNPAFAQASLESYLSAGRAWRGTLVSVISFPVGGITSGGFLLAGDAQADVASISGSCGSALPWLNRTASMVPPGTSAQPFSLYFCPGDDEQYQAGFTADRAIRVTLFSLTEPASKVNLTGQGGPSFALEKTSGVWSVAPQTIALDPSIPFVNAASGSTLLAPGALLSIRGTGLVGPAQRTTVEVDGRQATVVTATPFALSAVIPLDMPVGQKLVTVRSAFGSVEGQVSVEPVAPGIFVSGTDPVINNANGQRNSWLNPARRGDVLTIYCTGLGTVRPQSQDWIVTDPVTVVFRDNGASTYFAGLAPGMPGVYVIVVPIPRDLAPSATVPVTLRQRGVTSLAVPVAIE